MRDMRRHLKNLFGQVLNPIELTAAAGDEHAGAGVVEERLFLELTLEQLEALAQSQMNDRIERLPIDFLPGKPRIVFQQDRLPRQTITEGDAAFFDLQLFRARHRYAQPHRDVIGDVVAPNTE